MVYNQIITSTKDKSEAEATNDIIHVTWGLVYFIEVYFPPGSGGLLHMRLLDGSYCMFPATPGQSFIGNNTIFRYDDLYLKEAEPFQFVVQHWNEDDTYDHKFMVNIGMVSQEVYRARFMPTVANEHFKRMIAELQTEKQEVAQAQNTWGFTILGRQR